MTKHTQRQANGRRMADGRFVGGLWAGLVKCRGEVGAERGRGGGGDGVLASVMEGRLAVGQVRFDGLAGLDW